MSLVKLFLNRKTSKFQDFLNLPHLIWKIPVKVEVFPARRSLITDIPGFPAGI
jgi:hypothetical protein